MNKIILFILILIMGCFGYANQNLSNNCQNDEPLHAAGAAGMPQERGRALGEFLNPDGTLALPPGGMEGSIDPSGYRLVSGPDGAPRFEPGTGADETRTAGDEYWDSRFTLRGTSGQVYAIVWDGTNLYIGGSFLAVGNVAAAGVAKWNGTAWTALGSGLTGPVYALAWDGTYLYAGGGFSGSGTSQIPKIAKWDGSTWSVISSSTNPGGTVYALACGGGSLYMGGSFTSTGTISAARIAKWNGSAWSALDTGANNTVKALAWDGSNLYAGGAFTVAGRVTMNYIGKWDGSAWSALGTGMNGEVRTLAWVGGALYAGGAFTTAGGSGAGRIARWSGGGWSDIGSTWGAAVDALAWDGSILYAGGEAANITTWNGSAWSTLGSGTDGFVTALAAAGTNLYAGGAFAQAGGTVALNIAKWGGSAWSAVPPSGQGLSGIVRAIVPDGTNVYVGGDFTAAGGLMAGHIAKWDGSAWSALGAGVNSSVYALAWDGMNLYAGGNFTAAGGGAANYIAKWDGTSWSALGSGMNGAVYALAWDGTNLYAGGSFSTAGGGSAYNIARWNGSAWSALGPGLNLYVYALLWDGTRLYVGGYFDRTQDWSLTLTHIAMWDGSAWNAVGSGTSLTMEVRALAWSGLDLYAGMGRAPCTTPGYCLEKWDFSLWTTMGSGYCIYGLYWDGIKMYEAMTSIGEVFAITSTGGSLGSGANHDAVGYAVTGRGTAIYVGGDIATLGGKVSAFFGIWDPNAACPVPTVPTGISVADANACAYSGVRVNWAADATNWGDGGSGTRTYDVLRAGAAIATGIAYGTTQYIDTTGANGTTYSYAVRYYNGCGQNAATTGASAADLNAQPGVPLITAFTDVTACAQSGVRITYSAGSGASSHNLLKDGTVVVTGYASGATYVPGDTSSHTYVVRAVTAGCTTDSSAVAGTDANNGPGAPAITGITDISSCLQSGIQINFTPGSGATSHNLLKDDTVVVTGYASGATYNPSDTRTHTYVIRAVNASCSTDSSGFAGTDAVNGGPGAPAITSISDVSVCAQSGIRIYYTAGSGAASHNLLKDGSVAVTGCASGALYNPGDALNHFYVVQAVNGSCATNGSGFYFADGASCKPPEAAPGWTNAASQSWSSKSILTWPSVSGATSYTVYRGTHSQLANLLTTGVDSCTRYSGASTSATDSSVPAAGQMYWYLVTAGNASGEGTAGCATTGQRIVNSLGTCP